MSLLKEKDFRKEKEMKKRAIAYRQIMKENAIAVKE